VVEREQITDLKRSPRSFESADRTVVHPGGGRSRAARDLSTNRTEIGDAAVAFHVDGFYSPRPQGAAMLIYDLDRLEALRGPVPRNPVWPQCQRRRDQTWYSEARARLKPLERSTSTLAITTSRVSKGT